MAVSQDSSSARAPSRLPPGVAINELGEPWPPADGQLPKLSLMDRILDWFINLRRR
jgi:hypothetical protein